MLVRIHLVERLHAVQLDGALAGHLRDVVPGAFGLGLRLRSERREDGHLATFSGNKKKKKKKKGGKVASYAWFVNKSARSCVRNQNGMWATQRAAGVFMHPEGIPEIRLGEWSVEFVEGWNRSLAIRTGGSREPVSAEGVMFVKGDWTIWASTMTLGCHV